MKLSYSVAFITMLSALLITTSSDSLDYEINSTNWLETLEHKIESSDSSSLKIQLPLPTLPSDLSNESTSGLKIEDASEERNYSLMEPVIPYEYSNDYVQALNLSLMFFEAQRSGRLTWPINVEFRLHSAMGDRGLAGEDLTGGYYDGPDTVKFTYTIAFTTTILSWGAVTWPHAYKAAGQQDKIRETIKWATDYLIKCHPRRNEMYGQVGNKSDTKDWKIPEDINNLRPVYKIDERHPGSDLAGESAAALAAAAVVFNKVNPSYSIQCVKHAVDLYQFARNYRGTCYKVMTGSMLREDNERSDVCDDITWGAIWLYLATADENYLQQAESLYETCDFKHDMSEFNYKSKVPGIKILLSQLTGKAKYRMAVRHYCDSAARHNHTPKGLLYINKNDTLGLAAHAAFLCLQAAHVADTGDLLEYRCFAKQQIDYMLGSTGRSYVVGYGHDPPTRPYHFGASCPFTKEHCTWTDFYNNESNAHILYGALVSGPNENDVFYDRKDLIHHSFVSIDNNAGFTSALAGLINLRLKD